MTEETITTDVAPAPAPGRALTPTEKAARARRNWAILLALLLFVGLVFAVTVVRLGASVAARPF